MSAQMLAHKRDHLCHPPAARAAGSAACDLRDKRTGEALVRVCRAALFPGDFILIKPGTEQLPGFCAARHNLRRAYGGQPPQAYCIFFCWREPASGFGLPAVGLAEAGGEGAILTRTSGALISSFDSPARQCLHVDSPRRIGFHGWRASDGRISPSTCPIRLEGQRHRGMRARSAQRWNQFVPADFSR